jgi:hypothetical protein
VEAIYFYIQIYKHFPFIKKKDSQAKDPQDKVEDVGQVEEKREQMEQKEVPPEKYVEIQEAILNHPPKRPHAIQASLKVG